MHKSRYALEIFFLLFTFEIAAEILDPGVGVIKFNGLMLRKKPVRLGWKNRHLKISLSMLFGAALQIEATNGKKYLWLAPTWAKKSPYRFL